MFVSASGIRPVTPARRDTCRASAGSSCGSTASHNVPDVEAHGADRVLEPTYSVRFTARELWGEGGADGEVVHVDLWDRYLEEER